MKLAVIGAGAVGCLIAGYMKLADEEVELVGRRNTVETIRKNGIRITGVRGNSKVAITVSEQLQHRPDLAIITTKTVNIDDALAANIHSLRGTTILTIQNDTKASQKVARFIPKGQILTSLSMFGVTSFEPGVVNHDHEGVWTLGNEFGDIAEDRMNAAHLFLAGSFSVQVSNDVNSMKYLKLCINTTQCIPAILGTNIQETFSDLLICELGINVWREGLELLSRLEIPLSSIPGFPVESFLKIREMPISDAAYILFELMTRLSGAPLYGSILQSILQGKASEVDFINGFFVELAKQHGLSLPLNEKLVAMVHEVERTGKFFVKDDLIREMKTCCQLNRIPL
jgi:2-dehydropantoate 2-reductase